MIQRATIFVAAFFLLSATAVRAELVIDPFNTPADQSLRVTAASPNDSDTSAAATALGGWRDISLARVSGQPIYVDVFSDPGAGLYLSEGTGEAVAIVTWDGENSPSVRGYSLNANLTSGGEDKFLLSVADVTGSGVNVTMTVYTNDGTHFSATDPLLVTAAGDIPFSFASFIHTGPDGPANFADIDAIVLQLDGTGHAGSDVAITSLKTAVPEPSTLVLAAVGALALLGVGRRLRKV